MIWTDLFPFLLSFAGSLVVVGIAWGVLKQKAKDNANKIQMLNMRIDALECFRNDTIDRLARIEVKIDDIKESINKLMRA